MNWPLNESRQPWMLTAVIWLVCALAAISVAAMARAAVAAPATPPGHTLRCPAGYFPKEVRLEHQRLESDPRPDVDPVVTPNTWPEDNAGAVDRRYTVALACVRQLTREERDSEPYTDIPTR
jgi:hypothetical protein